ncbi:hypothetical protein SAMN05421858_4815 [Haladaptatus litoreus]|uniref:Uncharacterized protein n=1 Tax=Haladaptatus litoreus TaxID=553468 RepID=A0A1N7F8E9_9EURY|nr:hypothetical protein SAMN05421858_4815 [Haladaptatus litoreus]
MLRWFNSSISTKDVPLGNKQLFEFYNATEDGTLDAFPSGGDDFEPEDCDCECLGGFPCWPCMRMRRIELPN